MAKFTKLLPAIRRIYEADVPEAPQWLSMLLRPINSFFSNIFNILDGNVTFQDNIQSKFYDIVVNGNDPTVEITLNDTITDAIGVLLLQVIQTNGEPLTSTPGIEWRQVGTTLEITKIWGLASGLDYNVRILVI